MRYPIAVASFFASLLACSAAHADVDCAIERALHDPQARVLAMQLMLAVDPQVLLKSLQKAADQAARGETPNLAADDDLQAMRERVQGIAPQLVSGAASLALPILQEIQRSGMQQLQRDFGQAPPQGGNQANAQPGCATH